MRLLNRSFLLFLLLLLPQHAWTEENHYVTLEQIDFSRLLAPPPAIGSLRQKQEMDALVTLQKDRTPAMEAFANADAERSVFRFADVVGENFMAVKLPQTAAFFKSIKENADYLIGPAKKYWDRPRPYVANPELHPCVTKPGNASYPSGHSTFGTVVSIVLANMLPERQTEIYDRAELYRQNREIGGAHYPSDVEAGRIAGTVIAASLFQSPAFQDEYAKAKAEVRNVMGLPVK